MKIHSDGRFSVGIDIFVNTRVRIFKRAVGCLISYRIKGQIPQKPEKIVVRVLRMLDNGVMIPFVPEGADTTRQFVIFLREARFNILNYF